MVTRPFSAAAPLFAPLDTPRMSYRYDEQQLTYGATVYLASLNFCRSSIFAASS